MSSTTVSTADGSISPGRDSAAAFVEVLVGVSAAMPAPYPLWIASCPAPGINPHAAGYTSSMATNEGEQLQPQDTLDDRGVDDILDEGISPPEKLRGSTAKSVTPAGETEGETIDERLLQEEPDPQQQLAYGETADPLDTEYVDDGEVGDERSGRLVAPDEGLAPDTDRELVADDTGIDGGAAGAEEAAVHTVPEDELP